MSLPRHLLAVVLVAAPVIGCDVEDDDTNRPAEPAPAEPARPIPQPQVRGERVIAFTGTRPGDGPAFARSLA